MLWARQDNVNALAAVQRDIVAGTQGAHRPRPGQRRRPARRRTGPGHADGTGGALRHRRRARTRSAARADRRRRRGPAGPGPLPADAGSNALPRELGMELLARRPDLQAARWRVEAQLGRMAASEAAFRPDINLAGAIGLDAVSLGKLLRYPSRTPLLGATLDLPLFDSGRLKRAWARPAPAATNCWPNTTRRCSTPCAKSRWKRPRCRASTRKPQAHAASLDASRKLAANAEARQARGLADRAGVLQARQAVLRQRDSGLQLLDARLQTQVALVRRSAAATAPTPLPPRIPRLHNDEHSTKRKIPRPSRTRTSAAPSWPASPSPSSPPARPMAPTTCWSPPSASRPTTPTSAATWSTCPRR
jgi:multidrug efflux system outer membrane protein